MTANTYKKDVKATLFNQIFKIFAGPVLLLFIPLYLTPLEQGYWYTFTGLAALAVFADLGFSTIILQFVAHEFTFLRFDDKRMLTGDEDHLWRLASFFRFSFYWLLKVIGIIFPLIIIGGYFFLINKEDQLIWQGAWIVYAFASAIVFFNSTLLSFFEGCDSVSLVQGIRVKITAVNFGSTVLGLYFNLGLYALSISLIFSSVFGLFFLVNKFSKTIKQLWKLSRGECYKWNSEFYALIWRYSISWCSGYFIFQLFTPLAFKYHGPVFAGKIGISIAMWTAGFSIATSWVTAVIPKLNMCISENKWQELDKIFYRSLILATSTMFIGGSLFLITELIFRNKYDFFSRVLDIRSMFILFLCWMFQTIINTLAIYLRSHKKEPLMFLSLISAFYVAITTFLCARYLSEQGLFLGFLSSYIYGLPVCVYIFNKKRQEHYLQERDKKE